MLQVYFYSFKGIVKRAYISVYFCIYLYIYVSFSMFMYISVSQFDYTYKFNPLETKRRPLYLKAQSVPRCKHFSSTL
jgi:hypothetical protein